MPLGYIITNGRWHSLGDNIYFTTVKNSCLRTSITWCGLDQAAGTVYKQCSSAHTPPPLKVNPFQIGDQHHSGWEWAEIPPLSSGRGHVPIKCTVYDFQGWNKASMYDRASVKPIGWRGCTLKPATSPLSWSSELFRACFTSKLFPAIITSSCDSPSWQDQPHRYLCTTKEAQRSQALTSSGFRCLHTNASGSSTILPYSTGNSVLYTVI